MSWQEKTAGWVHDENNIKGFFGEYRWLSNFELCTINYRDLVFTSSEAAYQGAKTVGVPQEFDLEYFTKLDPFESKKLGRKVIPRPKWDFVKLFAMDSILRSKFNDNPELAKKLKETGNKYLEETNWWGDTYWGVCKEKGQNMLLRIGFGNGYDLTVVTF